MKITIKSSTIFFITIFINIYIPTISASINQFLDEADKEIKKITPTNQIILTSQFKENIIYLLEASRSMRNAALKKTSRKKSISTTSATRLNRTFRDITNITDNTINHLLTQQPQLFEDSIGFSPPYHFNLYRALWYQARVTKRWEETLKTAPPHIKTHSLLSDTQLIDKHATMMRKCMQLMVSYAEAKGYSEPQKVPEIVWTLEEIKEAIEISQYFCAESTQPTDLEYWIASAFKQLDELSDCDAQFFSQNGHGLEERVSLETMWRDSLLKDRGIPSAGLAIYPSNTKFQPPSLTPYQALPPIITTDQE